MQIYIFEKVLSLGSISKLLGRNVSSTTDLTCKKSPKISWNVISIEKLILPKKKFELIKKLQFKKWSPRLLAAFVGLQQILIFAQPLSIFNLKNFQQFSKPNPGIVSHEYNVDISAVVNYLASCQLASTGSPGVTQLWQPTKGFRDKRIGSWESKINSPVQFCDTQIMNFLCASGLWPESYGAIVASILLRNQKKVIFHIIHRLF